MPGDKLISCQTMDWVGLAHRAKKKKKNPQNCANQSKENIEAIWLCSKLFCKALHVIPRKSFIFQESLKAHKTRENMFIFNLEKKAIKFYVRCDPIIVGIHVQILELWTILICKTIRFVVCVFWPNY